MLLREAAYVPLSLLRQYGSVAALRRHQLRGLNAALAHAREAVPFYRARAEYHRGPLRSLADFSELPMVTKAVLRKLPQSEFVADGIDPSRCHHFATSGTTGHRVSLLHDPNHHDYHMAASVRRFLATNRYLPTHRLSHLRPFPAKVRRFERLGLFRRHVILTTGPIEEWKRALLAHRPKVLIGYPVHLRELLRNMSDADRARLRRTLRMVMTESELLVPEHRAAITAGFGVPVFDEYSSFEVLNVSYECAAGGFHLAEDRVHVEIVDEDGRPVPDGVEGQIVCTAFQERGMPLLRYAMGDSGLIETGGCACRRRFRTLRLTRGRLNDCVVLPDGTRLFADAFLTVAAFQPGVSEMYVRQDVAGTVNVHVVADGTVPLPGLLAEIRRVLEEKAGGTFPLELMPTDRIPLSPGGKGQFVQSAYPPALEVNRP
jgi:phenylacetate-CoA ligase